MEYKFKVGDRVRINEEARYLPIGDYNATVGDEGVVTKLKEGYVGSSGTVVTNEKFKSGWPKEYGEHGLWLKDIFLELVS